MMIKRTDYHRKGSVIVMVVGLLVMLAMIGTTFIIVAHMDRREARSIATAAPMKRVADGVLQQIRVKLAEDLHCGDQRPYQIADKWSKVIDHPSEDVDKHLASYAWPQNVFSHISNMEPQSFQGNNGYYLINVPASDMGGSLTKLWAPVNDEQGNPIAPVLPDRNYVDTDNDGKMDAVLLEAGVSNRDGLQYYYAVRVVDLTGLVNINTAYGPTYLLPLRGVPAINLRALPDDPNTVLDEIHTGKTAGQGRCGTGASDDVSFNNGLASRLAFPDSGYLPYDMADELACRWTGTSPRTDQCRLATNMDTAFTDNNRKLLTVFNADRMHSCYPLPATGTDGLGLLNISWPTGTDDQKVAIVAEKLYSILKKKSPLNPDGDKDRAAHLAINCVGFRMPAGVWGFTPSDKPNVVYCAVQDNQPVIAEAYAKASKDYRVYAVELYNPHGGDISLDEYSLDVSGVTISLTDKTLGVTSETDRRLVVYSKTAGTPDTFFKLASVNSLENDAMDLKKGKVITLLRTKDGKTMPIDQVSAAETGDVPATIASDDTKIYGKDASRDDNLARVRYNVAKYKYSLEGDHSHSLGLVNGLTDGANGVNYATNVVLGHADFTDLGQLAMIYFTGARVDTSEVDKTVYHAFPVRLAADGKDCPTRGRLCLLPEDDTPPESWQTLSGTKWTIDSKDYPPVPLACFMTEYLTLLTGDPQPSPNPSDPPANATLGARVYGRINVNTASEETLKCLPWPSTLSAGNITTLCDEIISYREKVVSTAGKDWKNRQTTSGIANLRKDDATPTNPADIRGFLTAGEVSVPAAVFMKTEYTPKSGGYQANRDLAFMNISNLLTVRSDVYAVYITVMAGSIGTDSVAAIQSTRQYVAIVNRSNCQTSTDLPNVLMFAEMK